MLGAPPCMFMFERQRFLISPCSSMFMLPSSTMDDAGLFMQWTLSTLQQDHREHPPVPAAAGDDTVAAPLPDHQFGHSASLDCIVPGRPPALERCRRWAATSRSSGDPDSGCGGGNAPVPAMERDVLSPPLNSGKCTANWSPIMSWNSSHSASPHLSNEDMRINSAAAARAANGGGPQMGRRLPPTRINSPKSSWYPSAAPYAQDHTIAERKRREKISQRLIELSIIIPGLTKTDRATMLAEAVRYVKELQEKLRALEDGGNGGRSLPAVLAKNKKPRVATPDDEDAVLPSYAPAAKQAEIDARISGDNVMVRVHCQDAKGVLVKLLSEVEGLHLSILDINTMPFLPCTLIINIMAKVEEGFDSRPDDIVGRLKYVLHEHGRQSSTEEKRSSC